MPALRRDRAVRKAAESIQERLHAAFRAGGDIDNWRDVGWEVKSVVNGKPFEVYFAPFPDEGSWLLAIAPLGQPGFVARVLGQKPFECVAESRELAREIHSLLTSFGSVTSIRWMFGGPPGKVPSYDTPDQMPWAP